MKTRRILSSILSFVMIFTLVVYSPRVTFAENNTAPASESIQDEGKESGLQAEDSLEGMVDQDGQSEEDDEADGETDKDDDTIKDTDKDTEDSSTADGADDTSAADEGDTSKDNASVDNESSAAEDTDDKEESSPADETDAEETDESGAGNETGAANENGNAGSESSAADENGNAGNESSAADESGSVGNESSAADESESAGSESSAADELESAGSESNAADESESTGSESSAADESEGAGAQEESTVADETPASDDPAVNETEGADAETDAAENESTPAEGTEAGAGTGNVNDAGSTIGAGDNSSAGGGTKLPLASDSNASVGGAGGAGAPITGESQQQLPTAEELEEMSMAEIYELFWSLDAEDRDKLMGLMSEEDWVEFLDYMWEAATEESAEVDRGVVSFMEVAMSLAPVAGPQLRMAARLLALNGLSSDWQNPEGVLVNKTVSPDEDEFGKYWLSLESYVTGEVEITEEKKTVPTDIVLVLDQSTSMGEGFSQTETYEKKNPDWTTNASAYENRNNLYYEKDGKYYKITVNREKTSAGWFGFDNYQYTYSYTDAEEKKHSVTTEKDANNDSLTESIGSKNPEFLASNIWEKKITTISRLDALKDAVNTFVNSVLESNQNPDGTFVGHRIGMVGFGIDNTRNYNYKDTEYLTVQDRYGNPVKMNQASDGQVKNALVSIGQEELNPLITDAIGFLSAESATRTDLGIEMAKRIFTQNPLQEGENRKRVVVVFTDGEPTKFSDYSEDVADDAIDKAKDLKDNDVTVYSVGIFDGAAPESDFTGWDAGREPKRTNRFMHYLSSNYPQATDLSNGGGNGGNNGYYLAASNADELSDIFEQIAAGSTETGGASYELGADTVVRDIISPSFMMPEGSAEKDIIVQTADYVGEDGNGQPKWAEPSDAKGVAVTVRDKTIDVTGFDYSENFVGTVSEEGSSKPHGKKLIIKIPIVADYSSGTFGGGIKDTNAEASGIYLADGTPITEFEVPEAYVPIRYEADVQDQAVYLTGTPDFKQLIQYVDEFEPDGNNNADVDIVYTFTDPDENEISYTIGHGQRAGEGTLSLEDTVISLMEDTLYTVSVKASSVEENGEQSKDVTPDAGLTSTVYVLKPTIPFQDSIMYLGEDFPSDFSANVANNEITWTNTAKPTDVAAIGEAPTITYTFAPEDGFASETIEKDTYIKATEKIGDIDVTGYVTADHKSCNLGTDCQFNSEKGEFMIHVKTCSLTIEKQVKNPEDTQQMFIFQVSGPDSRSWTVAIQGAGKKTITGLPIGNYTVSEDVDWSWRYKCDTPTKTCKLAKDAPNGKVTIENVLHNDKWLSDEVEGNNVFDPVPVSGSKTLAFLRKEETYEF